MKASSSKHWGDVHILPENESAVLACRWVKGAANGGRRPPFSVLFLHGEHGTGKSHLVRALAAARDGTLVTSAVDFSRNESDADFAGAELLAVEDVHRLPVVAVERLVTLLDDRSTRRRITVITSAESPFELRGLPRRLTSRLGGGLTVAIRPPGAESRLAVLTAYVRRRPKLFKTLDLPRLVDRTGGGYRELLGAADAWALERRRTLKSLKTDPTAARPNRVTFRNGQWAGDLPFDDLLADVAKALRIPGADVRSPGQLKSLVTARQTFTYLARYVLKARIREITTFLNRSPSSFATAKDDLRWKMVRDPALHAIVTTLESDWRAKSQKLVARVSTGASEAAREDREE